jgi:hypothetical protein
MGRRFRGSMHWIIRIGLYRENLRRRAGRGTVEIRTSTRVCPVLEWYLEPFVKPSFRPGLPPGIGRLCAEPLLVRPAGLTENQHR